jgi:capsular exopolysaccharide synthesis family protein
MSQFFKALEQAERDRLREKGSGATSRPAPLTTAPDIAAPPAETSVPTSVPKPAAPQPVVPTPVSKPARPPEVVTSPLTYETPSPASVFRPGLRARDGVRRRVGGSRRQPVLIAQSDPGSIEAEAYRTVCAKIELTAGDRATRQIAITSVTNGDGKSTSAANLAIVAAQRGRRVCLVDGDLRRPTFHDLFGLPNVHGLASALAEGKPLHTVARASDVENLSIVVAGRGSQEIFQDLLTPQRLEKVIRESEAMFDLVLFDTPPVFAVADALNVVAAADGVILVVRAGSVPFSVLRRAVQQIGHVKGRVLGVLLNRVDLRGTDADFYRYYRAYHATGPKA